MKLELKITRVIQIRIRKLNCVPLLLLLFLFLSQINIAVAYQASKISLSGGLPASLDNSQTPWFPPVGIQNHGCTSFSVGYYIKTFQEAKEHNWTLTGALWEGRNSTYYGHPSPSYQDKIMSPAFLYNLGHPSGSIESQIDLVCNIGVCTWAKMPYDGNNWTTWPSEEAWIDAAFHRGNSTSGIQNIDLTTDLGLTNLKSLLAFPNLASIYIDASALKMNNLGSQDLLTLDNYNSLSHNHVNAVVGYDDAFSYVENGMPRYGAFKIVNSWGAGVYHWENVPDGFYWISYEAMKQRFKTCLFYDDLIDYVPSLMASFKIAGEKRSDFAITVGVGYPDAIALKSLSSFVSSYPYPYSLNDYFRFPDNDIVVDISEFEDYLPSILNQTFWLRVTNGGNGTNGTITNFSVSSSVGRQNYANVPIQTVRYGSRVLYLNYDAPVIPEFSSSAILAMVIISCFALVGMKKCIQGSEHNVPNQIRRRVGY